MEQRRDARRGKWEVTEKTCRPVSSSGTIPTRECPGLGLNPVCLGFTGNWFPQHYLRVLASDTLTCNTARRGAERAGDPAGVWVNCAVVTLHRNKEKKEKKRQHTRSFDWANRNEVLVKRSFDWANRNEVLVKRSFDWANRNEVLVKRSFDWANRNEVLCGRRGAAAAHESINYFPSFVRHLDHVTPACLSCTTRVPFQDFRISTDTHTLDEVHAVRREHCTPVKRLALSGDGALDERGSVALIAPAFLGENGVVPKFKGVENGRSPRKPADQRPRLTRLPLAKIRGDPAGNLTLLDFVGGEQSNRSATGAPEHSNEQTAEAPVCKGLRSLVYRSCSSYPGHWMRLLRWACRRYWSLESPTLKPLQSMFFFLAGHAVCSEQEPPGLVCLCVFVYSMPKPLRGAVEREGANEAHGDADMGGNERANSREQLPLPTALHLILNPPLTPLSLPNCTGQKETSRLAATPKSHPLPHVIKPPPISRRPGRVAGRAYARNCHPRPTSAFLFVSCRPARRVTNQCFGLQGGSVGGRELASRRRKCVMRERLGHVTPALVAICWREGEVLRISTFPWLLRSNDANSDKRTLDVKSDDERRDAAQNMNRHDVAPLLAET
ncbi:hypothetical protein PR048_031045 [Dryococelus australis]|uniref:Uncharacterized protein n=1 Tax=Dryococelus australis TaxID=614101 RepID=A0ABQ9G447_9NEOP|nr:hypothetical protein PR048_031045 [Dryococelus australis]